MNELRLRFCILCLSVLTVTLCQAQSNAEPNATPPKEVPIEDIQLEMNFREAPLQTVAEYLSEKAGLVILSDTALDRRLTVISRSPVNVDEAIGLIDSILKDSGYSAVRQGRTLRIVTLEQARKYPMPVVKDTDPDKINPDDSMQYQIVPIRYRNAAELAENLQPLMPEYAILQANQEGNVLLITDTRANIKRILEIVKALDSPMSAVAQIQVFQLKNADAASTATLITNLFQDTAGGSSGGSRNRSSNQGGRGGRGGPGGGPGAMFEMFQNRMGGGSQNGAASTERGSVPVTASADSRTNSVVVSASAERMIVIQQMIKGLDTTTADIADVKVYHLEYADAENTAELINDVFGATSSSRSRSSQQNTTQFRGRGGFNPFAPGGGDSSSTTTSSNAQVVASADSRTNSIVVSGPPETLMVIEGIIKELDANPEQERQIFPYPLKNANAANVMTILNSLFDEIQALNQANTGRNNQTFQGGGARGGGTTSSGGTSGTGTGSAGGLDEETYFEADEESNTLLVMTSAKNYERVKPIIDELDKPVGQVLIKVLFAEVVYSDSLDIGAEFSSLNLANTNSTTMNFGGQGKSSDMLTTSTLTGNWAVAVEALEEKGKLNVLSRPYVLTSNNQLATISVAQEIPIPTGSTTVAGQTQVSFDYREDIGITLEVTPSINPNGLVNMTVSPKITTRINEKLEISTGVFAEAFATRSATTKVAVMNGQTIVIGGLIEDQIQVIDKKVPVLGSLPLLGGLFRHKSTSTAKTELLIFLTPYVAEDALALTPIYDKERSLSNIQNDETVRDIFQEHMKAMEPIKDPNDKADTTKK